MRFYNDDIAIVESAAAFSDSDNEDEFFSRLLERHCSIHDLKACSEFDHLQLKHYFSEDKKRQDSTYSSLGAPISLNKIWEWAKSNNLDNSEISAVEVLLHELIGRMQTKNEALFLNKRSECIIALSTAEPNLMRIIQRKTYKEIVENFELKDAEKNEIQKYLDKVKLHPGREALMEKDIYFPLMFESVRKRFGINGPCSFLDAACASSVAAMMVAVNRLKNNECDLIVSGGLDFGINAVTLIGFSKVQVLSEEVMNPFDVSAQGMNLGEAGALFALMRLPDAKKENYKILGVIRNCSGSSDGVAGGLVEPTESGQVLAYENTYHDVPLYPLSYLECHGTGTILGDETEKSSVLKFFQPVPPLGSVKANIGHTVSAAGAVSVVKALKIIEHKVIPGMPNLQKEAFSEEIEVPKEKIFLEKEDTVRTGISSFGFGGANYHVVIDEYKNESIFDYPKSNIDSEFKLFLNARSEIDLDYVYELTSGSRIKVPPVTLPYVDPVILGGGLAVEKIFTECNLKFTPYQRTKIGVISASNFVMGRFLEYIEKVCWMSAARCVDMDSPSSVAEFIKNKNDQYLPFSEDSLIGSLNNLIAGKVTKNFDFKGVNFNVAAEKLSMPVAVDYAASLLRNSSGAFFLINVVDDLDLRKGKLNCSKVQAWLISDEHFSYEASLPIEREISNVQYEFKGN